MHNGQQYQQKVRIRVCGLLIEDGAVLLAQIYSPVAGQLVWMPPGGGLEFGESIEECLQREFEEETGISVQVNSLQFINEFIQPPFHAVELYYSVNMVKGTKITGSDPEHSKDHQLLQKVEWISLDELSEYSISPDRLTQHLQAFK